jgi:RimJ/RimL family protein N-acetyltransferase
MDAHLISLEPSRDFVLIRSILTDPRIYGHVACDSCPSPRDFHIQEDTPHLFVLLRVGGKPQGVWMFEKRGTEYEVHTALKREAYGGVAHEGALRMAEWLWNNTDCERLTTRVPVQNRLALAFAKAAGMKEYGISEKSFLKNRIMHDQVLLALDRPEVAVRR